MDVKTATGVPVGPPGPPWDDYLTSQGARGYLRGWGGVSGRFPTCLTTGSLGCWLGSALLCCPCLPGGVCKFTPGSLCACSPAVLLAPPKKPYAAGTDV